MGHCIFSWAQVQLIGFIQLVSGISVGANKGLHGQWVPPLPSTIAHRILQENSPMNWRWRNQWSTNSTLTFQISWYWLPTFSVLPSQVCSQKDWERDPFMGYASTPYITIIFKAERSRNKGGTVHQLHSISPNVSIIRKNQEPPISGGTPHHRLLTWANIKLCVALISL